MPKPPDKPDKIVAKIRATRGLPVKVAKACGIERSAVYQWTRVPIEQVHHVSGVLGIPPEQIRPDIFKPKRRA